MEATAFLLAALATAIFLATLATQWFNQPPALDATPLRNLPQSLDEGLQAAYTKSVLESTVETGTGIGQEVLDNLLRVTFVWDVVNWIFRIFGARLPPRQVYEARALRRSEARTDDRRRAAAEAATKPSSEDVNNAAKLIDP